MRAAVAVAALCAAAAAAKKPKACDMPVVAGRASIRNFDARGASRRRRGHRVDRPRGTRRAADGRLKCEESAFG